MDDDDIDAEPDYTELGKYLEEIAYIDPDELRLEMLKVQQEPEIECQHCGAIPDGVLTIITDRHKREHRICNVCAEKILRWL